MKIQLIQIIKHAMHVVIYNQNVKNANELVHNLNAQNASIQP